MTRPAPRPPSRRDVLVGGGLLALAGCLPGDEAAPPAVPAEVRLRTRVATEVEALEALYAAVLARFPAARDELSPLAAEHTAHVAALRGPAPSRPTTSPSPTGSPSPSATPPAVPGTLPAARRALAAAERSASDRRARQAVGTVPGTARLLASIAACEDAHAALLDAAAGR